jgi:hypothetical protein
MSIIPLNIDPGNPAPISFPGTSRLGIATPVGSAIAGEPIDAQATHSAFLGEKCVGLFGGKWCTSLLSSGGSKERNWIGRLRKSKPEIAD